MVAVSRRDYSALRPNPAIRSLLTAAGHDMGQWSDRHLVAIQLTAAQLAAGERVFVSASQAPLIETLLQQNRPNRGREHR